MSARLNVELHLGDCLDFMRGMDDGSVDAVVTDPPYGVGIANWDYDIPPRGYLLECLRVSRGAVLWFGAATKYVELAKYEPDRVLIWAPAFNLSKASANKIFYRYHPILGWRLPKSQDAISADVLRDNTDGRHWWDHPGTKPVSLMHKLVAAFGGDTIFDPFMGSGTTGVACMQLGRHFIGCEIDPDYYAIAEKRIEAARSQLVLPL